MISNALASSPEIDWLVVFSIILSKISIPLPKVSLKDYGFLDIAEEFASNTKTAWYMRQAFKWGGFTTVDRIG